METTGIFSIISTSLALVFNIIGLKLLHEVKKIKATQKVILTNLSVSDSLNAVTALIGITLIGNTISNDENKFAVGVLASFCVFVSCASLIIITIDRVIATAMPLKYIVLATRKRSIIVVVSAWLFTLAFVTTSILTCTLKEIHAYSFCITMPTEVIIIASYLLIVIKTRRQRKISGMKSLSETRQGKKMLAVACGIVVSFACLVAIPDLMIYLISDDRDIFIMFIQIYYFINPLIYIYCYPPLRELIKKKCKQLLHRSNTNSGFENRLETNTGTCLNRIGGPLSVSKTHRG